MYAAQQQGLIDSFARSVQTGTESLTSIAIIMGGGTRGDQWASAVKDRLATWGVATNPAAEIRKIIMSGQRAQREAGAALMQELIAAGYTPYDPKQRDYTALVRVHLDGCESGEYPSATKTGQAVARDMATKLLAKASKKRLRRAFQENEDHPGMRRISAIMDNSSVVAAASGSVSTCLGTLANTHKIARMMDEQLRRIEVLEAELATTRGEVARANARLDLKDQGTDWKEAARAILLAEPGLSNRELARRVGRNEKSIRKYLKDIKGDIAD